MGYNSLYIYDYIYIWIYIYKLSPTCYDLRALSEHVINIDPERQFFREHGEKNPVDLPILFRSTNPFWDDSKWIIPQFFRQYQNATEMTIMIP
jgi:hypothetical protein